MLVLTPRQVRLDGAHSDQVVALLPRDLSDCLQMTVLIGAHRNVIVSEVNDIVGTLESNIQ